MLFSKALKGKNIDNIISNLGSAPGAPVDAKAAGDKGKFRLLSLIIIIR
jgi:ribosomal protein L12E/L44/L45/RPP1/RPP2